MEPRKDTADNENYWKLIGETGKIIDDKKDADTAALDAYNNKVLSDPRVENVLVPIRDGLMICKKN